MGFIKSLLGGRQNMAANANGGYSQQQAAIAAESMRNAQQQGQRQMNLLKTPDEKVLDSLLNPDIPKRDHLDKYYSIASEAARHLALTNIPDEWTMHKMKVMVQDLFRVGGWSAPEYFDERQLKFSSTLHLYKSAGWTKNSRERDALNESKITQRISQDVATSPRETGNFFNGLLGR